jgi:DNA invertase Pin-like site-specific DNA recombinase
MRARLEQLGWHEVEVVDDDLGRSAAGVQPRHGFERMVAEVCLGKVGAVAAREVSRFARNSRDWQRLVEVCRIVDTLLIDHETVYDPRCGNDRLMLGLKGNLNEYELDILRLRSLEARQAKARRGELIIIPPVGYLKTEEGGLEKEPDRRVQETLQLLFRKCAELGSARQTLLWLIEHGLELPSRRHGARGWETVWNRPAYSALLRILQNPMYAGFYVYGKTKTIVEFRDGVSRKTHCRRAKGDWFALHPDHHQGYVSPEQFERIQKMLSNNVQGQHNCGPGAAKRGLALLTGLLRCGRCGRKLTVRYTGRDHDMLRYVCCRGALDHGEPRCINVGGCPLDHALSTEILRVVQPGAIEAAIQAGAASTDKHEDILDALRLDLKAARYATERAWKQYDAVDPTNRLVADELERRWNESLQRTRELEHRLEQEEEHHRQLAPPSGKTLADLAKDFERVWNDPQTDVRLKKRLARALIEEVIINSDAEAGEITLVIHWKGGVHTELRTPRRRRGQSSSQTSSDIVEAVREMVLLCPDSVIANQLNRNGLRTARGNRWTRERVTSLRSTHKIANHCPERKTREGWMNLTEAARYLGVSAKTLRIAVEQGRIEGKHPLTDGLWILKREHLERPEVHRLVERVRQRRTQAAGQEPDQPTLFNSITYRGGAL